MDLKEDETKKYVVEDEKTLISEDNENSPSLNKFKENFRYSFTSEENYTSNKEPQSSFSKVQSYDEYEDSKLATKRSVEKYHPPRGSLALDCDLVSKYVECSQSEEGLSELDDSTHSFGQKSSSVIESKANYKADIQIKTNFEDISLCSSFNKGYASPPVPSKQKLRNTKRRAGILYKKLSSSSKLCKVTSEYFNHAHNKNKKRWIPPRSPYALVQEDLFDNPWQLLVATIFLTKTTAKKALPQLHKFLANYPRPEDVLKANYEDIDEYFKPLGLTTTRSHIIMRFTVEFLEKDWTYPSELYGIGKYGDDSYRMFCISEWRQVSPDDIPLTMYRNWLLQNAERLGI